MIIWERGLCLLAELMYHLLSSGVLWAPIVALSMYKAFCDRHSYNQCLTGTHGDQWLFQYHLAKYSAKQLKFQLFCWMLGLIIYLLVSNYNALMAVTRGKWGMFIIIIFFFNMFFVLIIMGNYETTLWTIFSVYFSLVIVTTQHPHHQRRWPDNLYYYTQLHPFDANCILWHFLSF